MEAQPCRFMISFLLFEFAVVSNSPRRLPAARGRTDVSRVKKNGAKLDD